MRARSAGFARSFTSMRLLLISLLWSGQLSDVDRPSLAIRGGRPRARYRRARTPGPGVSPPRDEARVQPPDGAAGRGRQPRVACHGRRHAAAHATLVEPAPSPGQQLGLVVSADVEAPVD